jgi:hypothetical protein
MLQPSRLAPNPASFYLGELARDHQDQTRQANRERRRRARERQPVSHQVIRSAAVPGTMTKKTTVPAAAALFRTSAS